MSLGHRERLAWLHAWAGLVVGWLLFAVFLTGSLAVFSPEITRWTEQQALPPAVSAGRAMQTAQGYLQTHAAAADSWTIELPGARQPFLKVSWIAGFDEEQVTLDPASGAVASLRASEGGEFFNRVHYELHAGMLGLWVAAFAGLVLLVTTISGVIIHKRIFADLFTFRPRAASQRAWLDGHNVVGVFTLPFLLMIAYTGVSMSFAQLLPAGVEALYGGDRGAPAAAVSQRYQREAVGREARMAGLPSLLRVSESRLGAGEVAYVTVEHPGDQGAVFAAYRRTTSRIAALSEHVALDAVTRDVLSSQSRWPRGVVFHRTLAGLHFGAFGGYGVTWLYFLSGLGGCVVIAAGLTVFVEKRRKRRASVPPIERRFQAFAERMNVAAIAGVMLAAIAFLWGDRLIPADLRMREEWASRVFLATWLAALLHAMIRPPRRAWIEQLGMTATLCLALPLLNASMGGSPLWRSIPTQDWAVAGLDLTAFALGLCLSAVAARLLNQPAVS